MADKKSAGEKAAPKKKGLPEGWFVEHEDEGDEEVNRKPNYVVAKQLPGEDGFLRMGDESLDRAVAQAEAWEDHNVPPAKDA